MTGRVLDLGAAAVRAKFVPMFAGLNTSRLREAGVYLADDEVCVYE